MGVPILDAWDPGCEVHGGIRGGQEEPAAGSVGEDLLFLQVSQVPLPAPP